MLNSGMIPSGNGYTIHRFSLGKTSPGEAMVYILAKNPYLFPHPLFMAG